MPYPSAHSEKTQLIIRWLQWPGEKKGNYLKRPKAITPTTIFTFWGNKELGIGWEEYVVDKVLVWGIWTAFYPCPGFSAANFESGTNIRHYIYIGTGLQGQNLIQTYFEIFLSHICNDMVRLKIYGKWIFPSLNIFILTYIWYLHSQLVFVNTGLFYAKISSWHELWGTWNHRAPYVPPILAVGNTKSTSRQMTRSMKEVLWASWSSKTGAILVA